MKVWSKEPANNQIKMVKDLMTRCGIDWDRNILSNLFLPFEKDQILQISLSNDRHDDQIIWNHSPDGVYSFKSGY